MRTRKKTKEFIMNRVNLPPLSIDRVMSINVLAAIIVNYLEITILLSSRRSGSFRCVNSLWYRVCATNPLIRWNLRYDCRVKRLSWYPQFIKSNNCIERLKIIYNDPKQIARYVTHSPTLSICLRTLICLL